MSKCSICGKPDHKHTQLTAARCAAHRLEWRARNLYTAECGLINGATREQYETARKAVADKAREWRQLAEIDGSMTQIRMASACERKWSAV